MRAWLWVVLVMAATLGAVRAQGPKGPAARTVTLSGDNIPLSAVLRTLGEQTGVGVTAADEVGDPKLTLGFKSTPFWQALDVIAGKAGARPYLYGREGKIQLVKADKVARTPFSTEGPFRVALRRLTGVQDFETGGRSLTASLEIAWEPHLQPLYLDTRPTVLGVEDGNGKALPTREQGSQLAPTEGRMAMQVDIALPEVPRSEQKLGVIEGKLRVLAPSRMATYNLGNLKELTGMKLPLVKKDGEASCSLNEVKLGRSVWTVKVELLLPPGGPEFESFQSWVANNELYLVDGKTRVAVPATNFELVDSSSRRARLTYYFEDTPGRKRGDPADQTLFCRAPVSIVDMPVPFRFRNVPLP